MQELAPTGADASGFGAGGIAYLPYVPTLEGESSTLFGALFPLRGGGVQASFGGAGELFRFTSAGAPDPSFTASAHPGAGHRALALAMAPGGETFALREASRADGGRDPRRRRRRPGARSGTGSPSPARLPGRRGGEEQLAVALLAGNGTLTVLAGEELLRIAQ